MRRSCPCAALEKVVYFDVCEHENGTREQNIQLFSRVVVSDGFPDEGALEFADRFMEILQVASS